MDTDHLCCELPKGKKMQVIIKKNSRYTKSLNLQYTTNLQYTIPHFNITSNSSYMTLEIKHFTDDIEKLEPKVSMHIHFHAGQTFS